MNRAIKISLIIGGALLVAGSGYVLINRLRKRKEQNQQQEDKDNQEESIPKPKSALSIFNQTVEDIPKPKQLTTKAFKVAMLVYADKDFTRIYEEPSSNSKVVTKMNKDQYIGAFQRSAVPSYWAFINMGNGKFGYVLKSEIHGKL